MKVRGSCRNLLFSLALQIGKNCLRRTKCRSGVCSLSEVHGAHWLPWTLAQHMDLADCHMDSKWQVLTATVLFSRAVLVPCRLFSASGTFLALNKKEFQLFITSCGPEVKMLSRGPTLTFRRWPERIKMVLLWSKLGTFLLWGVLQERTETFLLFSDGLKMAVRSESALKAAGDLCKITGVLRLLPAGKCTNLANSTTRNSEAMKCSGWSGASSGFSLLEVVSGVKFVISPALSSHAIRKGLLNRW